MPSLARQAAFRVLQRVSRGAKAADALDRYARPLRDVRDRALCHELVLGVLRRRGWLDHVLARLCERPFASLAPAVSEALRLGAYQILYLRVPSHAAVSESVELARSVEPRAAGFVNAILRRLLREGPPAEPDAAIDPLGWLTSAGSLPGWLAERWYRELGPERSLARARAALEAPPTYLRLNPRVENAAARLAAAGVSLAPTFVPEAFLASGAGLGRLVDEGVAYLQDVGSQLVARLSQARGTWLDACAAPGGKALLLADTAARGARIVASEASLPRLAVLRRLAARWGAPGLLPLAADALRPAFRCAFDGVLLDAPCSGLGTLARHPDVRWRLRASDVERHAARQRALLDSLAPLVRPGGELVYATCSLEPEETHQVIDRFLAREPSFVEAELPDWARSQARGRRVEIDPARSASDGFFAVRLRRAS